MKLFEKMIWAAVFAVERAKGMEFQLVSGLMERKSKSRAVLDAIEEADSAVVELRALTKARGCLHAVEDLEFERLEEVDGESSDATKGDQEQEAPADPDGA